MDKKDTKQIILDAAEELFSRHGFYGTSMRNITGTAGVNLSAVNYHFGSKEALLEAVFERRLIPLNRERIDRLNAVKRAAVEKNVKPLVRDVLQAFIEPTLRFKESEGSKNFIALIGQSLFGQDKIVGHIFFRHMAPVFIKLFSVLRDTIPDMPEKNLLWRLHFGLGSLFHAMHLSSGALQEELMKIKGDDEYIAEVYELLSLSHIEGETLMQMLTSFICSGIEAQ